MNGIVADIGSNTDLELTRLSHRNWHHCHLSSVLCIYQSLQKLIVIEQMGAYYESLSWLYRQKRSYEISLTVTLKMTYAFDAFDSKKPNMLCKL